MRTVRSRSNFVLPVIATALLAVDPFDTALAAPAGIETLDATEVRAYDIPAGPLGMALSMFAARSGIALSFDPVVTAGKSGVALVGQYTARAAAEALIAGTGLELVRRADGTYALETKAAPEDANAARSGAAIQSGEVGKPRQLARIEVQATQDEPAYTATTVGVGGKLARDPRQVQQSVSVITSARIEEQNLTNVIEAVREATGVIVATTNYQSIFSRGFEINNLQYDGGSPALANNYANYMGLPDLASYDHVEVLRGSDGLFSGAGPAGGTVNLVRKKPLDFDQVQVELLTGSWKRYRAEIDATGPLALDGRLRGRLVAAHEKRDYFYDVADRERTVLYGVLAADLTDTTLATLGARYEGTESTQYFTTGLPRYADGGDLKLSRSTCICTDWSGAEADELELFAEIEQALTDEWSIEANLSRQVTDLYTKYLFPFGAVDRFTHAGPMLISSVVDYAPRQTLADVALKGEFALAGHEQEIVIGANWQDVDGSSYKQKNLTLAAPDLDVFHFDPSRLAEPAVPPYWGEVYSALDQRQNGIYVNLRSQLTPALHSVIGLRHSNFEYQRTYTGYDMDTGAPNGADGDLRYEDRGILTPYAGLTYDLSPHISVYGSFASTFESQANLATASGKPLDPMEGNTYEIGAKGSWLDGALSASAATYVVKRENEGVLQPEVPGNFPNVTCCYVAAAEVRSKGVEVEIAGAISPGWNASFGYTYNTNEYESGHGADDGSAYFPLTPKHLLKIWTMARLPGVLSGWSVGGGVNAQSDSYNSGEATIYDSDGNAAGTVPFRFSQGGYVLMSLRGEYRLGARWSAALNINNLFDKTYYQTVGNAAAFNFYGEPRNVLFTLKGTW